MFVHPNQSVLEGLTSKYDIHFNFFLTKPTNEIIYNHPTATPTINFKDAAIFADRNQYLKRYYFLINQQAKPEITDRIQLLADFYANAVLLRHEYPLMILTNTKSIFLKRLKRMKKILVEEGSSDESHSPAEEKAVSINSSRFLKTISSGELERKSFEDIEPLHLDLSLLNDDQDASVYDVFSSSESPPPTPLSHLTSFHKEFSCQLILEPQLNEEEVSHLTLDFDDFDKEDVINRYNKLLEKENSKTSGSKIWNKPKKEPLKLKQLIERKPMATSITISGLEDQDYVYNGNSQRYNYSSRPEHHKHSMIGPRFSELPSSKQQHGTQIKKSSIFSYQLEHQRQRAEQLNQYVITEVDREESPKGKYPRFNSGDGADRYRVYSNRDKNFGSPQVQNSKPEHLPLKSRSKIFSQEHPQQQPYLASEYQQPNEYPYIQPFYENYPPNRTTSINININNLDENRDGRSYRMNKYSEEVKEQERQFRAEKKKKIREKAAALLNRVKSQEYLRTIHEQQDQEYQGYYH